MQTYTEVRVKCKRYSNKEPKFSIGRIKSLYTGASEDEAQGIVISISFFMVVSESQEIFAYHFIIVYFDVALLHTC